MGAFYSNLQIKKPSKYTDEFKENVKNAIKNSFQELGLESTNRKSDSARTIVLLDDPQSSWLTVCDQGIDEQDDEVIGQALSRISSQLNSFCVGIRVYDSDFLVLDLYHHGEFLAQYNSSPNYFGDNGYQEMDKHTGDKDSWEKILSHKSDLKTLEKLWNKEDIFIENILKPIAKIYDWSPKYIFSSYQYVVNHNIEAINNPEFVYFKKIFELRVAFSW